MKIILKNSITKKLSIYHHPQPSNIRFGDIITFVRELQGNFNFLLSYYLPYDSTPYEISNQQDLNKLIDIEKESKFIQISIEPSQTLPDKSFEQYFNSHENHCHSRTNSNNLPETSNEIKSERSQVGKFRKVKNLNEEQSDVSEVKEGEFLKSQVTQVVEKQIPTIVNLITNQLSSKKIPTTDLKQPSHKSRLLKPQTKNQFQRDRRMSSHNQYEDIPRNDQFYGSTFKISDVNTMNSHLPTQPQTSPYVDPYSDPYAFFYENRKRQIESAKYLRPPTFYENHYNQYATSKQIYPHHHKIPNHLHQYNSYENSGNILLEVVAPRKKSTHSKRKVSDCKNCQVKRKNPSIHKKYEQKKLKQKDDSQKMEKKLKASKLKAKIIDQKVSKVSKSLGMTKNEVLEWVQAYCYLQPIQIIQKIKENKHKSLQQKSVQTKNLLKQQSHSSFVKSAASSKRLVTEATNMTKGRNLLHRMQRIESSGFQNPRSQLKDSVDSQRSRKLSVRSISNALPTKTMKEKGGILIRMKQMFGQDQKSQIFKFIEKNDHLSEESIIKKWIKKHQFQP